jgi:hypothetical protein
VLQSRWVIAVCVFKYIHTSCCVCTLPFCVCVGNTGDTVFLGCQRSGSSLEWEPKMGILLENKCCAAYEVLAYNSSFSSSADSASHTHTHTHAQRPRQITPDRVKESNTLVSLYDGYALVCCETDARDAATQDLLEITCGRTEGYKHFQASVGGMCSEECLCAMVRFVLWLVIYSCPRTSLDFTTLHSIPTQVAPRSCTQRSVTCLLGSASEATIPQAWARCRPSLLCGCRNSTGVLL